MGDRMNKNAGAFVPSWIGSTTPTATNNAPVLLKRGDSPISSTLNDPVAFVDDSLAPVVDSPSAAPSAVPQQSVFDSGTTYTPSVSLPSQGSRQVVVLGGPSPSASPASPSASSTEPPKSPTKEPQSPTEPKLNREEKKEKTPKEKKRETPPELMGLKKHVNLLFIGHVDAGKSTISGHLMQLTGELDDRTLEKYEKEAAQANRESWKYAWALDVTEGERAKGKTEECGRASFETETRRFTILDAPGHRNYVPFMIGGAAQADIAILVVSARKGEFETGFERGGQTREHAMLVKTAGVKQLVVAVNKMDDPTVEWSQTRYDQIVSKMSPYLKSVGFNLKTDVIFTPVSGFAEKENNLREPLSPKTAPWSKSQPLLTILEDMKPPVRLRTEPFRMSINDKYKEMGTVVMGKIESGVVSKGQQLFVMPNRTAVEVIGLQTDASTEEVEQCEPGDNVRMKLKGIEEEDVRYGYVVVASPDDINYSRKFEAQLIVLEHKSIICPGYSGVLHIHNAIEECVIETLVGIVDKKTNTVAVKHPKFVRPGQVVRARIAVQQSVCIEAYSDFPQLGRFILRDEGKTVGVGIVTKLPPKEKR